jgi:hypothetical protein
MMATFADSEAVIWRQVEQIRQLQHKYRDMQQIVSVLARRQAGVLIIEPRELAELPSGAVIASECAPDGRVIIRLVTGEPGQPGSAG